jgi:hypothetical protein
MGATFAPQKHLGVDPDQCIYDVVLIWIKACLCRGCEKRDGAKSTWPESEQQSETDRAKDEGTQNVGLR